MGGGNFDSAQYKQQAKTAVEVRQKGNSTVFATSMQQELNPKDIKMSYSKSGPFNIFRKVTTVAICLDVTGSMGGIPKKILEGDLGTLMERAEKIFGVENNLQICFAAVGDVKTDKAPFQVGRFETDNRFAHQLQKFFIEGGGGGNNGESYNLPWYFFATKTR